MMTSAQVVETSVTVTDNSRFQDYPHPDDHNTWSKELKIVHLYYYLYANERKSKQ